MIRFRRALVHDKVYWYVALEEDRLMLKRLLVWLISVSATQACADISVARCHFLDGQGVELLAFRPLYPVRHWSRYRVTQNLFVDLRYNFFASSVAVRTMEVPHYPWTFSETLIDQGALHISGGTDATGVLSIDHVRPGARILCQEGKET